MIPLVDIGWEENVAGVTIAIDTLVPGEIVSGEPVPATPSAGPGRRHRRQRRRAEEDRAREHERDAGAGCLVRVAGTAAALSAVASTSSPASHGWRLDQAGPRSAGGRATGRLPGRPRRRPAARAPPPQPEVAARRAGFRSSSHFPFVAVLLDLARRVALERATWPSGHRRRVPDTPG